jgi:hypothetical protein
MMSQVWHVEGNTIALLNEFDECNKALERFTNKSKQLEIFMAGSRPVFSLPLPRSDHPQNAYMTCDA